MIWLGLFLILLAFQFVVLFLGAPYVPTRRKQREAALDLLQLKKGQVLIDLGCGDGAMLKTAASRGLQAIGYEINPLLVAIARFRTRRYGKRVQVIQGNFWHKKWPPADGVFVFLTDRYMERLHESMQEQFDKPIKLITYGFSVPNKKSVEEKDACFLYQY